MGRDRKWGKIKKRFNLFENSFLSFSVFLDHILAYHAFPFYALSPFFHLPSPFKTLLSRKEISGILVGVKLKVK